MDVDIGIPADKRQAIADGLSRVLADTYTLYIKTHGFHWNVTGPHFPQLHAQFEAQYIELRDAADEVAERIRALGHFAPGSYGQFTALASIPEEQGVPSAPEMIRQLVIGHEAAARTARAVLPVAQEAGDEPTTDLVTQRLIAHQKAAWMLRSQVE